MDLKEQEKAASQINRHPWEKARFEVVMRLLNRFVPKDKMVQGSVADVGCGDAWFVNKMAKKFPSVQYLAIDTAFNGKKMEWLNGFYQSENVSYYNSTEQAFESVEKINLILLLDVVEHIKDDQTFLRSLTKHLQNQTYFIVTVPAFQSLFSSHDVFLEHYRRYTSRSISKVCEQAGLEVVHSGYFFFSLFLVRFLQQLTAKKKADKQQGVANWQGGKFITYLVQKLLLWDFKFFFSLHKFAKLKLPGLSTYAICRYTPS